MTWFRQAASHYLKQTNVHENDENNYQAYGSNHADIPRCMLWFIVFMCLDGRAFEVTKDIFYRSDRIV